MKFSNLHRLTFAAACAIILIGNQNSLRAQGQEDEPNVRGAFLTSRASEDKNKRPSNSARPTANKPTTNKPATNKPTTGKLVPRTPTNNAPNNTPTNTLGTVPNEGTSTPNANANSSAPVSAVALGLGYTLYMRDPVGDAVRVDPGSEFRAGDRIRLVLEPSADGYLYVFHTENDGAPQMIYPDARLERGANAVRAHVPYEVPSAGAADERLRWFVFDEKPAAERLYVFVSREPLTEIPTGDALVGFCTAKGGGACLWQPSAEMWTQLKAGGAEGRVQVSKSRSYGQTQTATEREASTRGFGLSQAAPEPSVVRMNVSSTTGLLMTTVDLIHK